MIRARLRSMVWDGRQLDKQLSRHWPAQLVPEQILSDLQLAFWPAQNVQRALQAPWQMDVTDSGRSLLPVGVLEVRGDFERGAAVACRTTAGDEVARGLVNYSAIECRRIARRLTAEIEGLLGYMDEPELIHRDNMVSC